MLFQISSEKMIGDMKRTNKVTEKDELEASVKKNLVQINVDTNEVSYSIYLNV